jgi:cell division protein FtsL
VRSALFLVALVGLLFVFVYPTRTFLDQRNQTNRARAQLSLLETENAKLTKEAKQLSTDSAIERLARQTYGLVKPGETPFVILPAPTTATTATTAAPAPKPASPAP